MDSSADIFEDVTEDVTAIELQDIITDEVNDEYLGYFESLGSKSTLFSDKLAGLAEQAAKDVGDYLDALVAAMTIFKDAYEDNDPDIMRALKTLPPATSFTDAWDIGSAIGKALESIRARDVIADNLTAYAIDAAAARLEDDTIVTPKHLARAVRIAQDPDTSSLKDVCDALRGCR